MASTLVIESSEPAWDIARLFPHQGAWTEEDYLALETNQLVEFSHGQIEVLPMPTESHQSIVVYLYEVLKAFLTLNRLGKVLIAPLRVRLWAGKYREPDVVVMLAEHADRRHEQYWDTPDLVMEVVSPEYRRLDLETKRHEYARAGIPEYWIIDPETAQMTVLALQGDSYEVHGVFGRGAVASSALLKGFEVSVAAVWEAAKD